MKKISLINTLKKTFKKKKSINKKKKVTKDILIEDEPVVDTNIGRGGRAGT